MAVRRRKTEPVAQVEERQEDLKKWKKIGGGPLILGNRYIKPGQVFYAAEWEVPMAFRDVIIELPFDNPTEKVEVKSEKKQEFKLQHKGGGWYDIVDSNGKVLNENAMKKEEAAEFLESL